MAAGERLVTAALSMMLPLSLRSLCLSCVATHCVLLVSTAATAHYTAPLAGCAPAPAQVQPGSSGSSAQWPDSAPRHQWPL